MPPKAEAAPEVKVSLATPDDISQLIELFWATYKGPGESIFPHTDNGRKWLERSFQNFMSNSFYRPQTKIPVVRNPNGRPVSMAIVHTVKPGQSVVGKSWKTRWSRCDDLPDMSEEKLAGFFEPSAKAHHLVVGGKEGHVFIELLTTKYAYRRKGYATALLQWATEHADELGYPCYLDGGGRGMHICEMCGFKAQDVERRYGGTPPCVPMLRPKKDS
ncbi:Uu.00g144900.m01.CDS01 [Anthostomella pinea]|uniref:Uu.00g144900.m01.CDS01 n=1 Tax=Anthostomella pinea TaxID=933095 RepID=A0AAI8VRR8_9PEZI|nr:Uu.00g144900.m01.CDS01 [Anthostomella pinea]